MLTVEDVDELAKVWAQKASAANKLGKAGSALAYMKCRAMLLDASADRVRARELEEPTPKKAPKSRRAPAPPIDFVDDDLPF